MIARVTAALLITSLAAAAACGSGDKSSLPQTAPSATAADPITPLPVPTNNDPTLEKALLAPADLGPQWTDPGLEGATLARTYLCDVEIKTDPQVVVMLTDPADGRAVFESVGGFSSDSEAKQLVQQIRESVNTCGKFISTDGVARTEWKIVGAPLRQFGDESLALIGTTRFEGVNQDVAAYFVVIRRANRLIFIVDETPGQPMRAATEALVALADAKFARVQAEAP